MSVAPATQTEPSLMRMQTQLRRDQRCEASTTIENWQQFLTTVAAHSRAAAGRRRRYRMTGMTGWLAGFAAIGLIWIMPGVGLFIALASILAGLLLWRIVVRPLQRQATQHHVLQFVLSLLSVLRADMVPGEPLRLRLDLRGGTVQAKQTEKRPPAGGKRSYPQIAETWYVDPWLAGETRLVDGSVLAWGVVDHIRQRTVTKRNPRGKIKRKTKYKVKRCIDVRLGARQDIYRPAPAARPAPDHLSLRSGTKRHIIKVRRVLTRDTLEAVPQARDVLDLIAQAYKSLVPLQGKGWT